LLWNFYGSLPIPRIKQKKKIDFTIQKHIPWCNKFTEPNQVRISQFVNLNNWNNTSSASLCYVLPFLNDFINDNSILRTAVKSITIKIVSYWSTRQCRVLFLVVQWKHSTVALLGCRTYMLSQTTFFLGLMLKAKTILIRLSPIGDPLEDPNLK
jgi:hypothetical protein